MRPVGKGLAVEAIKIGGSGVAEIFKGVSRAGAFVDNPPDGDAPVKTGISGLHTLDRLIDLRVENIVGIKTGITKTRQQAAVLVKDDLGFKKPHPRAERLQGIGSCFVTEEYRGSHD